MATSNARWNLFCEEFVANGYNGTKAYLTWNENVTEETAATASWRLLRNEEVKEYIAELKKETLEALKITREDLLKDLLDMKESSKNDPRFQKNSLKAIEIIAKMYGLNEPDKSVVDMRNSISWNETKNYEQPLLPEDTEEQP